MLPLTTLDFANEYFLSKLDAENWGNLEDTTRKKLLIEASRRIYSIQGFKYTSEVVELLSAIPNDLQQACCEVAFSLLEYDSTNPHIINQRLGISSISFGNDSATYNNQVQTGMMSPTIFNDYAQALLDKYIIKGFKYV